MIKFKKNKYEHSTLYSVVLGTRRLSVNIANNYRGYSFTYGKTTDGGTTYYIDWCKRIEF